MGPDLDAPGTPVRCPACAASVRPGAPWCTQCYADLRTPSPVEPAPAAVPVALEPPPPSSPAPAPRSGAAPDAAAWPCAACGQANPLTSDACRACGAGFLSTLRSAEEPLLVLPVVGDLAALSRAQRLGLAGAVVLLVVVLTTLLGLLLG